MDIGKPVQLKFCVGSEWPEFVIDLNIISKVIDYDALRDKNLYAYLKSKAKLSNDVLRIDMLDEIFEETIYIDMTDKHGWSRIENLFVS